MSLGGASHGHEDRGPNTFDVDGAAVLHVAVVRGICVDQDSGCADWTDQQLVFAAPDVRDAAFVTLFQRHSTSVTAAARMVLGSASSACDDVNADVFTALWLDPGRFDPARGSLLGFLRLKARGRSIDLLRSETNRRRREIKDQNGKTSKTAGSAIETEFVAAETAQRVRHAVSALPEAERRAIELAYFDGMTYRAVADQLGEPEGTIKSRIRAGLQRLRTQLDLDDCLIVVDFSDRIGGRMSPDPEHGVLQ